jgi:hypothetical protein
MCLHIDDSAAPLTRRVVWKVFVRDTSDGPIVSAFRRATYPKGKLIERSRGQKREDHRGLHGLHFITTKARALAYAKNWYYAYIAKFAVNPKDFMFVNAERTEAMYERATRIGPYIKVT